MGNKASFLQEMEGATKVDVETVSGAAFPSVLSTAALIAAHDQALGGSVVTGGPCAGVALQRGICLLTGSVGAASIWRSVGGRTTAVIASDMVYWCEKDGFNAQHVSDWRGAKHRLSKGDVVYTIVNTQHWVTVIGVNRGRVYALDYKGLFTVPEDSFVSNVRNVPIFAPGCIVAMGLRGGGGGASAGPGGGGGAGGPSVRAEEARMRAEFDAKIAALQVTIAKLAEIVSRPPVAPKAVARSLVEKSGKSQATLLAEARASLGIDCIRRFNIAIAGVSGAGKSSFINALLGSEVGY